MEVSMDISFEFFELSQTGLCWMMVNPFGG